MKMLQLVGFLFRHAPRTAVLLVGAGLVSGAAGAGVLVVINQFLHRPEEGAWLLGLFTVCVLVKIGATALSQILVVRFSQDAIIKLSLSLCERISSAPLEVIERRGPAQLLTVLTDDVSWVVWAMQCTPQLVMNGAVIIGCGLYLTWLSWGAALGVAGITVIGAIGYHLLHRRTFIYIEAARDARATLFRHFRELTDGIKELLMHRARRDEFVLDEVHRAAAEYRRVNVSAAANQALMEAWAHGLFYLMIGLLMGVFAKAANLQGEALTGYVFAMLYIMGPIWGVIGTVPTLSRGQVGLEKIQELGGAFDSMFVRGDAKPMAPVDAGSGLVLELSGVTYTYTAGRDTENGFHLGPINLEFKAGELVFVVGGNGGGKSTFVKVLAGLYAPSLGQIAVDGRVVTDETRAWYRQHFSVIFSDFTIFEKLFGIPQEQVAQQGPRYLQLLEIDRKVTINEKTLSTLALSQGQRKRLALVTAFLEDRPVYIFDEWAADQDPHYKAIFYQTLLPELRRRGKLVIVITHDDRYFHMGDRVIKIEDGQVEKMWSPREGSELPVTDC